MLEIFCETVLRWRTSAACVDHSANGRTSSSGSTTVLPPNLPPLIKPKVQVPCYVIDESTGYKYDLSHLTRLRGAHKVEAGKMDLYINICQDITDPLIGNVESSADSILFFFHLIISSDLVRPILWSGRYTNAVYCLFFDEWFRLFCPRHGCLSEPAHFMEVRWSDQFIYSGQVGQGDRRSDHHV